MDYKVNTNLGLKFSFVKKFRALIDKYADQDETIDSFILRIENKKTLLFFCKKSRLCFLG